MQIFNLICYPFINLIRCSQQLISRIGIFAPQFKIILSQIRIAIFRICVYKKSFPAGRVLLGGTLERFFGSINPKSPDLRKRELSKEFNITPNGNNYSQIPAMTSECVENVTLFQNKPQEAEVPCIEVYSISNKDYSQNRVSERCLSSYHWSGDMRERRIDCIRTSHVEKETTEQKQVKESKIKTIRKLILDREFRKKFIDERKKNMILEIKKSIDYAEQHYHISKEESGQLKRTLESSCAIKDLCRDVVGYGGGHLAVNLLIHAISGAILAVNPYIAAGLEFSPISIAGLILYPYVHYRTGKELKLLKENGASVEKQKRYKKFYRVLKLVSFINFPPFPGPPEINNIIPFLLTYPRLGKLGLIYINYLMQNERFIPAKFKRMIEKRLIGRFSVTGVTDQRAPEFDKFAV